MSLIGTYIKLPISDKLIYLEIIYWLGLARLAIAVLPFRWLTKPFGTLNKESKPKEQQSIQREAANLGWKIRLVADRLPWECKCLVQSIAGRIMLNRRGLPSTVYIGVARDEEKPTGFGAHAWLRCGKVYVTGGRSEDKFTVLTKYA